MQAQVMQAQVMQAQVMQAQVMQLYDKNQTFWSAAPCYSLFDSVKSLIPFQNLNMPYVLPKSEKMPSHPYYEKALYKEKNGLEVFSVESLDTKNVLEYTNFLKDNFYSSNLNIKKVYSFLSFLDALESGILYGVEVRDHTTKKLIGIVIARKLGNLSLSYGNTSDIQASLVTELCIEVSYRHQGFSNLLLRNLYKSSVNNHKTYVHLFQVDSMQLAPAIPILDRAAIYGRKATFNKYPEPITDYPITDDLIKRIRYQIYNKNKNSISALNNKLFLSAYQTMDVIVVLRDLNEIDQNDHGEGAEIIYYEGDKNQVDSLLDSTKYAWFESKEKYSELWKVKGITSTLAFHLSYGYPSSRPFVYL